jgi:chemotaxis protein MotB
VSVAATTHTGVIKRIKKVADGHGNTWKIAVRRLRDTAMMAFFLLMWLLGSTIRATWVGIWNTSRRRWWRCRTVQEPDDSSSVIMGGGSLLHGQVKLRRLDASQQT